MKFGLWTANGALNSKPVFEAFSKGVQKLGHKVIENKSADIDVIWSILWNGRMMKNKPIYLNAISNKKPLIILEVGGLFRGHTWKMGLNGINYGAYFGPTNNDSKRVNALGLRLQPYQTNHDKPILIACQHKMSGQWPSLEYANSWLYDTINELRKYTDKQIIVRPHPRSTINRFFTHHQYKNIISQRPIKRPGTYDDYNLIYKNLYTVVNYSSNPGVQSIINGIPCITSDKSLAFPVSNKINEINALKQYDRQKWLNDIAYTEWTESEIATGEPIKRLTFNL